MKPLMYVVCALALCGCAAFDQYNTRRSAEDARARHAERAAAEREEAANGPPALHPGTTIRRIDACREERCVGHGRLCTMNLLDADLDGSVAVSCGGDDCRDNDPTVSPNMPEINDGIDNDCDGTVDETDAPGGPFHH